MDQASGLHKLSFLKVRNQRTKNNTCQAKMDKYMNTRKFSVSKSSKKITYWAYWAIITSNTQQGNEVSRARAPTPLPGRNRNPRSEARNPPRSWGARHFHASRRLRIARGAVLSKAPELSGGGGGGGERGGLSWVPGTLSVDFAATPQKTTTLNLGCKIDSERPSFQGRGGVETKTLGSPPSLFLLVRWAENDK